MSIRLTAPRAPCCNTLIVWDETSLLLPCVGTEYAIPVPIDSGPDVITACHEMMREHNGTVHDVGTSMLLSGVYGLIEDGPVSVGRHAGRPGPESNRCQCMGVRDVPGRVLRHQCSLPAQHHHTCNPCGRFCRLLVPPTQPDLPAEVHSAPFMVPRGGFN